MAASKKNSKGNKTAHVLNLLTAPGAPKEGAAGEEGTEGAAPENAAPSRPLLPPILEVAQTNDANLSQQIQQALEEELAESPALEVPEPPQTTLEEVPPMAAEQPVMDQTPQPAPSAAPPSGGKMSQDDIEKLLAAANTPAPEPEPEPAPAPAPAPKPAPAPVDDEDEDITYINIMQVLVEEKAPRYIKKFGLCDCKRCTADVKALTLTNLVPKYAVLSKLDRIPMLTVYEGRFNSTIFAQLTRACKIVMDHPHHSREQ